MTDSRSRAGRKPRVLFYVHDGWGLGHIRRVSKLAQPLQSQASCLLIDGHRSAAWIVPEECGYLELPSFDSLLSDRSSHWGRQPFVEMSEADAVSFRRAILEAAITAYAPDVIVTENWPLGKFNELRGTLTQSKAAKIFLTRGIMSNTERNRYSFITEEAERAIVEHFSEVLVAVDRKIFDLSFHYRFSKELADKLHYVGYMSQPVTTDQIRKAREERGLAPGARWIVCSAGGGALGEALIHSFEAIAQSIPEVAIDIVHGPRSATAWPSTMQPVIQRGNVRIHKESQALAILHAAADIVVCPGGYNSVIEAMEGGAHIISVPVQKSEVSEQYLHARMLVDYYPITLVSDAAALQDAIATGLRTDLPRVSIRQKGTLDFDGIAHGQDIILRRARAGSGNVH